MAKQSNTGIYQLPNGNWAYRFTQTINGKRHNHKSVKDENGEPMRSQKAAIRARQLAIMAAEARKTNNHSGGSHLPKSIKSIATRAGAESLYHHPQARQPLEKSPFRKVWSAFH
ncbi:MAG: hypothetical protein ACLUJG_07190 [Lawsonibacter sp.]